MKNLPELAAGQSWCCSNGCGECGTKETAFEYSREEFPNGDVISKTQRVFVSTCCDADLMLWDEGKQDFVEWDTPATNGAGGQQK